VLVALAEKFESEPEWFASVPWTRFPVPCIPGTGSDPRSRRRSLDLHRLPRGIRPGIAVDTCVLPMLPLPTAITSRRST
jgi:hypothetical protein